MAKIILGMGTSHGPMLSMPWKDWGRRVEVDRKRKHPFRGTTYTFDELVTLRRAENLAAQITPERWQQRYDACQAAIATLSNKLAAVAPDVVVMIGNDQREIFGDDKMPAFTVFWGEQIENQPRAAKRLARTAASISIADWGYTPPEPVTYPGVPALGRHLIESLIAQDFDVAQSITLPVDEDNLRRIPHAYGFVYRRLMGERIIPAVPVIINTFYPPNQPRTRRCFAFGKALYRAINDWPSDVTVAVIASGGLSHFVVDEDLDRAVMDAFERRDLDPLFAIPESHYQAGNSEIKNWIPLAAMMHEAGYPLRFAEYVPCYRSEAGTGNAMAFCYWE